jgi:hypothetical protein
MTSKGEIAILPRKEYEALAAKAQEADEDFGTARLIARARRSFRKKLLTDLPAAKTRYAYYANGAVRRSCTSRTRLTSGRVTFPTWNVVGEREQAQL